MENLNNRKYELTDKTVEIDGITLYGHEYKATTRILQACGFDVELENWDAE